MAELRLRVLRLLEERERSRAAGLPTIGEIAAALGEPIRNVTITLRSSEAMGMVELAEAFGDSDEDVGVLLKPGAFIYLESAMNKE